jgi:hypothetical protein
MLGVEMLSRDSTLQLIVEAPAGFCSFHPSLQHLTGLRLYSIAMNAPLDLSLPSLWSSLISCLAALRFPLIELIHFPFLSR